MTWLDIITPILKTLIPDDERRKGVNRAFIITTILILVFVLGRELLDGGRDTTRNPGNEARTKRKNDIKRRVGCSSKQGMAPDRLKLKTLNDNP